MEYSCHVWADTPSCYLELLYKLQKQICRTVGSSLPACLEPLAHGRCSSKLALLVPLPDSRGMSSHCSERLYDLLPFLDVTRMSMSTVSFLT